MVQIINENRGPTKAEKFSQAVGTGLDQGQKLYQQQQEDEALKEMGLGHLSRLSPELKKLGFAEHLKGQTKQKQEKRDLGSSFGNILDTMKDLKEYVGPLNLASLNPYSETSGKRSQINTLRLSLEGLFRDLTLKGQFPKAIYERILKELPQASDTEEQYLNKIEAIENIIGSQVTGNESSLEQKKESSSGLKNVKSGTPLTIEALQEIYDKVGGDKKKAYALARKMGYKVE